MKTSAKAVVDESVAREPEGGSKRDREDGRFGKEPLGFDEDSGEGVSSGRVVHVVVVVQYIV